MIRAKSLYEMLGCLLVLIWCVLAIPCLPFALFYGQLQKRQLLHRLQREHRLITWKEMEAHLGAGEGTLIVEHTNKVGVRFWWTPDDLTMNGPKPLRNWEDLGTDYIRGRSEQPFVLWCHENYLTGKNGKAFLTPTIGLQLPPGPVDSDYLLGLYPKARIVQTVLLVGKSR